MVILMIPEAPFGGSTRSAAGAANSASTAARLAGVEPSGKRAVSLVTRKRAVYCRVFPFREDDPQAVEPPTGGSGADVMYEKIPSQASAAGYLEFLRS